MSSPYLPFDIWKCVAEYLPDEQLKQLRTVNRALCLIAREIEYRKVGITVWDKNTKERLRALGDPDMGLGQHVRAVEITPWVIPCTVKLCTKRAKLWNGINTLLDSNYPSRRASDHLKRKLAKHTRLVTSTVQNLPHLQEYSVQWSPGSSYHPELFSAFLGPILHNTELGQNLTKLSVKAPTEKLSSLAPLHLPKLERLELDLHTGAMLAGEINDHFDALIVFVNNTMRTLRALSVASTPESTHLDLNRFFHRLGTFPNLTSFMLNIPYDGAHVSSPSFLFTSPGSEGDRDLSLTPMEHFIKKHADHIQELRLKCSRASPPTAKPNPHAKFWIQRILARIAGGDLSVGVDSSAGSSINVDSAANEEYPRLHTLEVPLRPLKSSLQPLRKCVSVLAGQLKSLTLTDRALMEDELKMIFNMSPSVSFNNFTSLHSLTNSSELSLSSACCRKPSLIAPDLSIATLSLRVQALSPSLLEVIAQAVPGLTKLELEIGGFARDYTPPLLAHSAMQHPHYKAWCLRKLKIKTPSLSRVQRWSQSQSPEKVLRTCIPGLEVETEIVRLV